METSALFSSFASVRGYRRTILRADGVLGAGVEFAADHAARDSSYAGLNYEAIKGDPQ